MTSTERRRAYTAGKEDGYVRGLIWGAAVSIPIAFVIGFVLARVA